MTFHLRKNPTNGAPVLLAPLDGAELDGVWMNPSMHPLPVSYGLDVSSFHSDSELGVYTPLSWRSFGRLDGTDLSIETDDVDEVYDFVSQYIASRCAKDVVDCFVSLVKRREGVELSAAWDMPTHVLLPYYAEYIFDAFKENIPSSYPNTFDLWKKAAEGDPDVRASFNLPLSTKDMYKINVYLEGCMDSFLCCLAQRSVFSAFKTFCVEPDELFTFPVFYFNGKAMDYQQFDEFVRKTFI